MAIFEGISHNGSIEDAIQNAVANAMKSVIHTDPMVEWRLNDINGIRGGVAGLNIVIATVETKTK